jgi:hypothetical protein
MLCPTVHNEHMESKDAFHCTCSSLVDNFGKREHVAHHLQQPGEVQVVVFAAKEN